MASGGGEKVHTEGVERNKESLDIRELVCAEVQDRIPLRAYGFRGNCEGWSVRGFRKSGGGLTRDGYGKMGRECDSNGNLNGGRVLPHYESAARS